MTEYSKGTYRSKRCNNDLLNNPFQPDDRSYSDLMGYIQAFLGHINFYDTNDEIKCTWNKIIQNDLVFLMVTIINEPIDEFDSLIHKIVNSTGKDVDSQKIKEFLFKWYDKIETNWYRGLLVHQEENLAAKIKGLHQDILKIKIDQLKRSQDHRPANYALEQPLDPENKIHVQSILPPQDHYANEFDRLKGILYSFKKTIIQIQKIIDEHLRNHLLSKNNHLPHNAMYITFALLFKTLQDKLNGIPQRHLDFYYKDILKQKRYEARASKTTVSFNLLPIVKQPSLIEKGSILSAGKLFGSKTDIQFETLNKLVVNNIELIEMETIYFNTSPYIRYGNKKALISSVYKNKLIHLGKDAKSTRDDWMLFGANRETRQNSGIDTENIADLGFIIGSPVLSLNEGHRDIVVHFILEQATSEKYFWKLINQIQIRNDITLDLAFSMVMERGFKISYSSKIGWVEVKDYTAGFDKNKNMISIELNLEISDPALEKFDENILWPSLMFELNPYAPLYLYSFFKEVELDSIKIDVSVRKMQNLVLYNNVGKISADKAFDIFGPFPSAESYLMIGNTELFKKKLAALEVELCWESIPKNNGGFDNYYEGYSQEINNESFQIAKFILSDGFWIPMVSKNEESKAEFLFNTTEIVSPEGFRSNMLNDKSLIRIQGFDDLHVNETPMLQEPLTYGVGTQSGFVKIMLKSSCPDFGAEIYQKDFAEIAIYNAKNNKNLPLPNKPYNPKISAITLNYKASDTLFFNRIKAKQNKGQLIHIRPFWRDTALEGSFVKEFTLFPNYESQGYLIFGLKGVADEPLVSIFFLFLRSGATNNIKKNQLKWNYFDGIKWVKLEKSKIIKDGTSGLTKSGIIELILPKVDDVPEGELYWLRVSTQAYADFFPKIKGIYLNAVQVICTSDDPLIRGKIFPPDSINKVMSNLPDIKSVLQPGSTYQGLDADSSEEFYGRVSERLRHKSRAVSAWDYERLLMDRFDNIELVKCTNLDKCFHPDPGKLKIVVLNSKWAYDERYYFKRSTLKYMKRYIKKRCSSFVKIDVINPIVEYLLVNCQIQLEQEDSSGFYINELRGDISKFLSPVSKLNPLEVGIGGSIVPNVLLKFIEQLDYVKKVLNLSIEHIEKNRHQYTLGVFKENQIIKTQTPYSVFNPVKNHRIIAFNTKGDQINNEANLGFGRMEIGTDFILQEKHKNKTEMESITLVQKNASNSMIKFKNNSR